MKMKATIEVEFEANEGQDEDVLRAALVRGRAALAQAIEFGTARTPTGIKAGSVKTEITNKEVLDESPYRGFPHGVQTGANIDTHTPEPGRTRLSKRE